MNRFEWILFKSIIFQHKQQKHANMSQEQSESVKEMVRRLLGLQMASWRKEDIEKKFKLVMQVYSLDMEISASKERFTELTKKNQKENNEIEVCM